MPVPLDQQINELEAQIAEGQTPIVKRHGVDLPSISMLALLKKTREYTVREGLREIGENRVLEFTVAGLSTFSYLAYFRKKRFGLLKATFVSAHIGYYLVMITLRQRFLNPNYFEYFTAEEVEGLFWMKLNGPPQLMPSFVFRHPKAFKEDGSLEFYTLKVVQADGTVREVEVPLNLDSNLTFSW